MPAPKGTRPPAAGRGRKVGEVNKITRDVKDMILAALDKAGGPEYLFAQSSENPTAFLSLVGKVLPLQITGANNGPVTYQIVTGVPREDDE